MSIDRRSQDFTAWQGRTTDVKTTRTNPIGTRNHSCRTAWRLAKVLAVVGDKEQIPRLIIEEQKTHRYQV